MATDPNNSPEAWVRASVVHSHEGRYAEAMAACDHALQLHHSYALAYALKGAALTRLNRFDEALACSDHALALDPTFVSAWNNKGVILRALCRVGEAEMAEQRAQVLGE